MARSTLVGDVAIFDNQLFPWVKDFEDATFAIQRELAAVLVHRDRIPSIGEVQPDQDNISDPSWKAFFFFGYKQRAERNCRLCPETTRALERIPGLNSAFFSVLAPGRHIPPHRGLSKGQLRGHLALVVPRRGGRCWMEVDGQPIDWVEGKFFAFDDSRKHQVWNDTPEERVALIIDFERPMRWPGRLAYRVMWLMVRFSPYFRDGQRNQKAWDERFADPGAPPTDAGLAAS
jgi:beta-hydroxylase